MRLVKGMWGERRRTAVIGLFVAACLLVLPSLAGANVDQKLTVTVTTPVTEGPSAELTFLVKLDDGPDAATFDYVFEGSASSGTDYTAEPGNDVAIPAGGEVRIHVPIVDDSLDEFDEMVVLKISDIKGADPTPVSAEGTITDNDDPPTVLIEDVERVEAAVAVGLTVKLSAASAKPISMEYRVGEASTATRDQDFKLAPGKLEFAPGENEKTIEVELLQDALKENDEVIYVVFSNHVNVQTNDVEGKVTIKDDSDAGLKPTIPNAEVVEGNAGVVDLVFKVTLAGPRPATTFNYRTVADTATGSDYVEVGGSQVSFTATSSAEPQTREISIRIKPETLDEFDERFFLELLDPAKDPSDPAARVQSAVGTIRNDDDNSALSVADASAGEPTTGSAALTFTVTLSAASARPVTVAWATADGTATAGVDYTAASGTLAFAPGETSKAVDVTLLGDQVNEDNETVKLVLSGPTGVPPSKLADAEGLGTIVDKNAPPSLSISDATANEGQGATVTVTLSGTTNRTVTVRFNTVESSARAASDFLARVGTLTFAPGEKTKTLEITIVDDTAAESREDFTIVLGDAVNAAITKASGRITIEASDAITTQQQPTPVATPVGTKTPVKVLAPRMVLGPRNVLVGRNGIARMSVSCQRISPIVCAGTVELERSARPLLKLGKRAFAVAKGKNGVAPVKLSAKALAILRKQGTMRVRVIVVYKKSVGTGRSVPGVVTLTSSIPLAVQAKPKPATAP